MLSVNVQGSCFAAAAARLAGREKGQGAIDLTIAEAIARAMGGTLDVAVAEGQGGSISVRFPLDMPMDELTERRLAGRQRAGA